MQTKKNHPLFDWCNFEVICQCVHEKSFAEDQVVLFDEDEKITLRKIAEQRVAFKFCVAEGTFSQETIKSLREAEN